eukprot:gene494-330_t
MILSKPVFDAYVQLLNVAKDITSVDIRKYLPKVVLTGVQNAGKSSFVESCTKIPVAYVADETATLCPVVYELHFDHEATDPQILWTFQGATRQLRMEEVVAELERHMQSLGGNVSSEEVVISIRSREIMDMYFVDLPGLIPNPSPEQQELSEKIQALNVRFVRDETFEIVAVLKSTTEFATNSDLTVISRLFEARFDSICPPRPDWTSHLTLIVNRVNDHFDGINNVKAANRLLHTNGRDNTFFVALQPDSNWTRKGAKSAEIVKRLKSLSADEHRIFDAFKAKLQSNEPWRSQNDKCFGVSNAHAHVQRIFLTAFKQMVPHLRQELRQRSVELAERMRTLQQLRDTSDPAALDQLLAEFSSTFIDHIYRIQVLETMSPIDPSLPNNAYRPEIYGSTFRDTFIETTDWEGFYLTPDEVLARVPPERGSFTEHWGVKLLGQAAYELVLDYFRFVIMSHELTPLTVESILTGSYSTRSESTFAKEELVIAAAKMEITNALRGMDWLRRLLMGNVELSEQTVLDHLLTRYGGGRFQCLAVDGSLVRAATEQYYRTAVNKLFGRVQERWNEDVAIHSETLRIDRPIRKLLAMLITPNENIVAPLEQYYPSDVQPAKLHDDNVPVLNTRPTISNLVRSASSKLKAMMTGAPTVATVAAAAGGDDEKKDGDAHSLHEELNPPPSQCDGRFEDVHDLVLKMRSTMKAMGHRVTVADFVHGGHVSLPAQERGNFDVAYLNAVAREYYLLAMDTVITNLDAYMAAFFLKPIKDPNTRFISNLDLLTVLRHPDVVNSIAVTDVHRQYVDELSELEQRQRVICEMLRITDGLWRELHTAQSP